MCRLKLGGVRLVWFVCNDHQQKDLFVSVEPHLRSFFPVLVGKVKILPETSKQKLIAGQPAIQGSN